MIYLYLKRHNITGLMYFGRTISKNPFKYRGSGTRWRYHCTKHGWNISTVEIWGFDSQIDCTAFALLFSSLHNIVESEKFANLEIEDGINGKLKGTVPRYKQRKRGPISERHLAQLRTNHEKWVGRRHSSDTIRKMRRPKTDIEKERMRAAALKRGLPVLTCPHCGKVGSGSGMHRFHFNHCKLK